MARSSGDEASCSYTFFVDDEDIYTGYNFDADLTENDAADEKQFNILNEADIRKCQEAAVNKICEVLSISKSEACTILHYFKWDANRVSEEWFANEEKIRNDVGLSIKRVGVPNLRVQINCGICFDELKPNLMVAAACGHNYCRDCWREYIKTAVSAGPGCLALRCPEPSCSAAVGQDLINQLATYEDNRKYSQFLFRAYVENNRSLKWCPSPGCEHAVEFLGVGGNYDVFCRCSNRFCWNCIQDAHRPVDCDTVAKWTSKNNTQYENMSWMLINSKPCPKCKRPIEKNNGCMHMTCTPPCKFEFCWLCLGPWSQHGNKTGGFFACNRYEKAKREGKYDEEERQKEMAKNSLERYSHYYERWVLNQQSREKASIDLKEIQNKVPVLSAKFGEPDKKLKFISEAWEQIVDCRRALQWTYAYGYYIPENERPKIEIFEQLQGDAEMALEHLHRCAEKEIEPFFKEVKDSSEFTEYRRNLIGLTCVTRKYFSNLLKAMEGGLEDFNSHTYRDSSSTPRSLQTVATPASASVFDALIVGFNDAGLQWSCYSCTYINPVSTNRCQMCDLEVTIDLDG